VRLWGGLTLREGRLEVYHNGVWGTVCDDGFTDAAARVVCYSFGLGYVKELVFLFYLWDILKHLHRRYK